MKEKYISGEDRHLPPKTDRDKKTATVTCMHCRYEYPASAPRCTICGYPWPWLKRG